MRRSWRSSPDARDGRPSPASARVRTVLAAGGATLAVATRWRAGGWDDVNLWLPDLTVGVVYLVMGVVTVGRHRAAGALLWSTGAAWLLGSVTTALLYLHRAPLLHLALAYPSGRPRRRVDAVAIVVAYLTAVATPLWADDTLAIVLSVGFLAIAADQYANSRPGERPLRAWALGGSTVLCVTIAGAAATTLATSSATADDLRLKVYELSLVVVGVVLTLPLGRHRSARLTDLVVEVGPSGPEALRRRFAEVLDDPHVLFGFRDDDGTYRSSDGEEIRLPAPADQRAATLLLRDDAPFAVLVHDAAALDDPVLLDAVTAAARLTADHLDLTAALARDLDELADSRRRLLAVADDERRRLETALRATALRDVTSLAARARSAAAGTDGKTATHLLRAAEQLDRSVDELEDLARGLHPRELALGLGTALESLAERSPVPVELHVEPALGCMRTDDPAHDSDLVATSYYVCAEALTNIAKHAQAHRASVRIADDDGNVVVTVVDDGIGIEKERHTGSGLNGLVDRVGALGGSVTVSSERAGGTRLEARFARSVRDEHDGRRRVAAGG